MQYEYKTVFFPVDYETDAEVQGRWFFKTEKVLQRANPEVLIGNPDYEGFMNSMGKDGWELISVQPLLEGTYSYELGSNSTTGFGYTLTAGYFFFWKRQATE